MSHELFARTFDQSVSVPAWMTQAVWSPSLCRPMFPEVMFPVSFTTYDRARPR